MTAPGCDLEVPWAAIRELTFWVDLRGSGEVTENVQSAMETICSNEEFINMTFAVLMTPE